ncbi:cytochrome b [Aliamphritea ceti]|uniref:cytochrome b n=1 Tax=Aliamphritea ceti TaxID=1524258 RepID=UPI0021C2DFCA|nr:cytochrome b/b6 domain-containing protein [Aliamphritea ceti]
MSEIRQNLQEHDQYSVLVKVIHWLMAFGFLLMWSSGYLMHGFFAEDSAGEEFIFGMHISTGVLLAMLLIIRIAARLLIKPPALPEGFTLLEKRAAHAGHLALYVLPAVIITLGWAETDFGGHGVTLFGIPMPKLFPTMDTWMGVKLEDFTSEYHELLAWTLLAVVVLHVAAVIKHRKAGHDVMHRMGLGK